jgi:hypothetical protein
MKPDAELSLVERSAHFVQIERALCDGGGRDAIIRALEQAAKVLSKHNPSPGQSGLSNTHFISSRRRATSPLRPATVTRHCGIGPRSCSSGPRETWPRGTTFKSIRPIVQVDPHDRRDQTRVRPAAGRDRPPAARDHARTSTRTRVCRRPSSFCSGASRRPGRRSSNHFRPRA